MSRYTMAEVIAEHILRESSESETPWSPGEASAECSCGHQYDSWVHTAGDDEAPDWDKEHAEHIAEMLVEEHYGDQKAVAAAALTAAADWLLNGEAAGIIAFDGPSNRGEVMAAYDAALEDPEGWLRDRAKAILATPDADASLTAATDWLASA